MQFILLNNVISLKANYIPAMIGAVTEHHITNKKKIKKFVCPVSVSLAACVSSATKVKIGEGLFVCWYGLCVRWTVCVCAVAAAAHLAQALNS